MADVELNTDEVRRTIFAPHNIRWIVWTVTSLLARYKIRANAAKGEEFERIKPLRRRAARSLRALWQERVLYRKVATDNRAGFHGTKYVRPEDAVGTYLVACERCGGERRSVIHSEGRSLGACPDCGASQQAPA